MNENANFYQVIFGFLFPRQFRESLLALSMIPKNCINSRYHKSAFPVMKGALTNLALVLSLSSFLMDHAYADNIEKTAEDIFFKQFADSRESLLNKIQSSLFDEEVNASRLGKEIKELIQLYKNYLQKLEMSKESNADNFLLKEIKFILAHLEAGSNYATEGQIQVRRCYSLISEIESILEKLENPANSFVEIEMPIQSEAIVPSLKKLKGEKIPYHLTGANIKKHEEADELPPLTAAHFKSSILVPEESELENRLATYHYD